MRPVGILQTFPLQVLDIPEDVHWTRLSEVAVGRDREELCYDVRVEPKIGNPPSSDKIP